MIIDFDLIKDFRQEIRDCGFCLDEGTVEVVDGAFTALQYSNGDYENAPVIELLSDGDWAYHCPHGAGYGKTLKAAYEDCYSTSNPFSLVKGRIICE